MENQWKENKIGLYTSLSVSQGLRGRGLQREVQKHRRGKSKGLEWGGKAYFSLGGGFARGRGQRKFALVPFPGGVVLNVATQDEEAWRGSG